MRGFLILMTCLISAALSGQTIRVGSAISSDSMRVGEWLGYEVIVQTQAMEGISWPQLGEELGAFEVLEIAGFDTLQRDTLTIAQRAILTIWEEGVFELPSTVVLFRGDTIETNAHRVTVWGEPIDSSSAHLIDVGPPIKMPYRWSEFAPIVYWSLGLLLLLALIIYFIRKWLKSRSTEVVKEAQVPAHIIAFGELADLKSKGYHTSGQLLVFYTKLSQILRRYLEQRFGFPALESTRDMIMSDLKKVHSNAEHHQQIDNFLAKSDLIKFAKAAPEEENHMAHFDMIYDFVAATKQEENLQDDE